MRFCRASIPSRRLTGTGLTRVLYDTERAGCGCIAFLLVTVTQMSDCNTV